MMRIRRQTGSRNAPGMSDWRMLSIVLWLAVQPLAIARADSPVPLVRPDPITALAGIGDIVTVRIYVQDVQGLYGTDIRLSFDPAILEVQDASPGTPGVQIQPLSSFLHPDFVVRKKACNVVVPADPDCQVAGTLWYVATQMSPTAPASGSGPVAAVSFKRLRAGDAILAVTNAQLVDRYGVPIPSTTENGRVSVEVKYFLPLLLR